MKKFKIPETGFIEHLPEKEYHAIDRLSAHGIKKLLQSPEHFRYEIDHPSEQTPAMAFGSAAHAQILTPKENRLAVLPEDINRRTKEGREIYEKFLVENKNKYVVPESDYLAITGMRERLYQTETGSGILAKGKAELSLFFRHRIYIDALCKARLDWVIEDLNIIADYKTTTDASPEKFSKDVENFDYDAQAWWYLEAANIIYEKDFKFIFVVQEKTPPYAVGFYTLDQDYLENGKSKCNRGALLYQTAKAINKWRGYFDEVVVVSPPGWLYKKYHQ